MSEQANEREPRRDPGMPPAEQAPGARSQRRGEDPPAPATGAGRIPGAAEDFVPRETTDVAQHAPGPHGQGDEPSSAPSGLHDYADDNGPEVRPTPRCER